jgi:hypothetical protein
MKGTDRARWYVSCSSEDMMFSWWWLWMVVMFLFLVPPLGYGWGYRGWGPPYPRYIQRRRGQQALAGGGSGTFDHHAWGRGGDFIWLVLFFGAFWVIASFWWR